jgi:nitrilase
MENMWRAIIDKAGILVAEVDLDQIVQSKFDWDPVGHYNRQNSSN